MRNHISRWDTALTLASASSWKKTSDQPNQLWRKLKSESKSESPENNWCLWGGGFMLLSGHAAWKGFRVHSVISSRGGCWPQITFLNISTYICNGGLQSHMYRPLFITKTPSLHYMGLKLSKKKGGNEEDIIYWSVKKSWGLSLWFGLKQRRRSWHLHYQDCCGLNKCKVKQQKQFKHSKMTIKKGSLTAAPSCFGPLPSFLLAGMKRVRQTAFIGFLLGWLDQAHIPSFVVQSSAAVMSSMQFQIYNLISVAKCGRHMEPLARQTQSLPFSLWLVDALA